MFVAIAQFPEVPTERVEEFQAWFAWSNGLLREIDGLQGRRLLRAADGTYTTLGEHQSAQTFAAMHLTEVADPSQVRFAAMSTSLRLVGRACSGMVSGVVDLRHARCGRGVRGADQRTDHER